MSDPNEKISKLYRETSVSEPSQHLDDAILQASREAIEKPARTGPFLAAWPAAASIAAVVVIAAILVPVLRQEELQQQTAQDTAGTSILHEYADEEASNLYNAGETAKKTASIPAAEDSATPEPSTPAKDRAKADLGISSSSNTLAQELQKSSGVSEPQSLVPESPDEATTSRMRAADSAPFAVLTPEMWEVRIERLIEQGEHKKARAEFTQLQQHFPDYQIKTTLLDKLRPSP
jgi:hypothetical protein